VPAPPPDELGFVDRPVVVFWGPGYEPPPRPPTVFLPPRPREFTALPPRRERFFLPTPPLFRPSSSHRALWRFDQRRPVRCRATRQSRCRALCNRMAFLVCGPAPVSARLRSGPVTPEPDHLLRRIPRRRLRLSQRPHRCRCRIRQYWGLRRPDQPVLRQDVGRSERASDLQIRTCRRRRAIALLIARRLARDAGDKALRLRWVLPNFRIGAILGTERRSWRN
jgi:hypothetical protein